MVVGAGPDVFWLGMMVVVRICRMSGLSGYLSYMMPLVVASSILYVAGLVPLPRFVLL
jgi:hypothetical protein